MKKRIIFSLIALLSISFAGFSLAIEESPEPAPYTYNYFITWDDSQCDCPNDQLAKLGWHVEHWENGQWVTVEYANPPVLVDPATGVYEVKGTATIIAGDKYRIWGKITYYYNEEPCCAGSAVAKVMGLDLINDGTFLHIVMQ